MASAAGMPDEPQALVQNDDDEDTDTTFTRVGGGGTRTYTIEDRLAYNYQNLPKGLFAPFRAAQPLCPSEYAFYRAMRQLMERI